LLYESLVGSHIIVLVVGEEYDFLSVKGVEERSKCFALVLHKEEVFLRLKGLVFFLEEVFVVGHQWNL